MRGGIRFPIIAKESYIFSSLTAGNSQTIVLAKTVNCEAYREATLMTRLHFVSIAQASASLVIKARTTHPSVEDPFNDYVGPDVATSTITNSLGAGAIIRSPLSSNFGSFLRIYMIANQGTPTGVFSVTISVLLSLKE